VPARALSQKGYKIRVSTHLEDADMHSQDIFIIANPHCSAELLNQTEACARYCSQNKSKKLIIDIDRNFLQCPPHTHGYKEFGPGNPQNLHRFETLLTQADTVIVPSAKLAEVYKPFAHNIQMIPPSWTHEDLLWEKPTPKRSNLHIGVISQFTDAKQVNLIKEGVKRLLAENDHILLTIGGDMRISDAFTGIPEKRKMFIPIGHAHDYPYLLAYYDILLIPLYKSEYDQSLSDQSLLEAGIRRIPWIASPNPAFKAWDVGGMFAEKKGDWYTLLRQLTKDDSLRVTLGQAGRLNSDKREAKQMVGNWEKVIFE